MAAGKRPLILKLNYSSTAQYLNLTGRIFDICASFLCHVTLNLEGSLQIVHPQKSFPISMKFGM